jgi:glutamate-1-semialdehyde 2,1-aminomutase
MKIDQGQKIYQKYKKKIPGGSQLLSKKPEIYLPNLWPSYYKKAKGCEITSVGKKKYLDCSNNSVGMCTLGYANNYVNKAVLDSIKNGNICTLNSIDELNLTDKILKLHPWFESVRYSKSGGEAIAIAIRIARAYSGREKVLFCGYHGWHDWYISANLKKKNLDSHLLPMVPAKGVPKSLANTAIPFEYNKFDDFKKKFLKNKNNLAAVIMEPTRSYMPDKGYLKKIRDLCKKYDVVFIFDEITSGWRESLGGIHKKFKVYPDIAVFSKAISNGYPLSCIVGKYKVMKDSEASFISSANWTERTGFAAALATINYMDKFKTQKKIITIGKKIKKKWKIISDKCSVKIKITGLDALPTFSFKDIDNDIAMTFFTQEMLRKKILASGQFFPTIAHKQKFLKKYFDNFEIIFKKIKKLNTSKIIKKNLIGNIKFYKFNVTT